MAVPAVVVLWSEDVFFGVKVNPLIFPTNSSKSLSFAPKISNSVPLDNVVVVDLGRKGVNVNALGVAAS